jgi:small subunit ribosomal protein S1
MSFNIFKQLNADEQEPLASNEAEPTATTNEPVEMMAETAVEVVMPKMEVETAHDDFDWSRDKRNVVAYSAEERKNMIRFMTTHSSKSMTAK